MNTSEFRKYAHQFADWMADYYENIEKYPVKSQVTPREIFNKLPDSAPEFSESIDSILTDFNQIIMPGISHWQSPLFFGYFNANASYPSILAEMLSSAVSPVCMLWETSPAAAELEEKVMIWLRNLIGLPQTFSGVIQDTASTSTLVALLTARERITNFAINENGFEHNKFRIYCSSEAHSSVEKDVKIAGFGRKNLVKIAVNNIMEMIADELEKAILSDIEHGLTPLFVVAALGTTGTLAFDPVPEIAEICKKYNIWLHIDAAYAGSAFILPEYKNLAKGIDAADSFVFNPHKWLFTNFDCSAYFVKDTAALTRTFDILPEYLKTKTTENINNYRDWGIQLGRRFRALKLWFVLRNYGVSGLQIRLREHIKYAGWFAQQIIESKNFELVVPLTLNVVCFRYLPDNITDTNEINAFNEKLLHTINKTGKAYLTHTKIKGIYTIRFVTGQTNQQLEHITNTWNLISEQVKLLV